MFNTENILSNEQRAHDLALLIAQAEINKTLVAQVKSENETTELDIYPLYLTAYHEALESFSKDFPD